MHRLLPTLLAVVLLGCAQPEVVPEPGPDPELGVAPSVTESEPSPLATPSGAPSPAAPSAGPSPSSEAASTTAEAGQEPGPTPSPSPSAHAPDEATEPSPTADAAPASSQEPVVLLALDDASGDHGARGPAWADLRSVELTEVANDLRVVLRFGGELPPAPAEGEVPLVGVDIGDEGYQLFVEGGGQSWAAYLDTPEGFVEFPGTFELAGRALVLQVPFSAVGSPTRAPVRVFAEWSRDTGTVGVLNPSSEDTLDGEPHMFDRTS